MLNIEEIVIYIIIIIGLICIIQIYNNMNPKISPIWEGLTNSDTKSTKPNKPAVSGLNSGAVEYNQDILGLITLGEIELKTNNYSDEYITALKNLKQLYIQRLLKGWLQINTADPYTLPAPLDSRYISVYTESIKSIDLVLQNLSNPQQSMNKKLNMNSYTTDYGGGGGGGGGGGDGEDGEGGGDEEEPKSSSWSPW